MRVLGILGILGAGLLASCASVENRNYYVSAIDTEKKNVPCVIYVDDEIVRNQANEEIKTPATIKVDFKPKRDGDGFDSVKLEVRAAKIGPDGKVIPPREGEEAPYLENWRTLYPSDSKRQLFILCEK